MKKIFFWLLVVTYWSMIGTIGGVHAQNSTPSPTIDPAVKYNITFPIASLGNCTSIPSCKVYCDDTTHKEACIAFAKQKGFYKPPALSQNEQDVLTAAKSQLGCDSKESCQTFCQNKDNHDTCSAFAKSQNLTGGHGTNLQNNTTLDSAKTILGCTSIDSCKTFCQLPENQQKCTDFAKANGLRGGVQYSQSATGSAFHIPPTQPVPTGMSKDDYCKIYPTQCYPTTAISPPSSPTYVPLPSLTPYPTIDKVAYCAKYGCFFNGTTCQCPTPSPLPSNVTHYPSPTFSIGPASIAPISSSPSSLQQVRGMETHAPRNFLQTISYFFSTLLHLQ